MTSYQALLERIRAQGERITPQRRIILEILATTRAHMTLQDIHHYLGTMPHAITIPEPTIYRILQWLKHLGIVSQTDIALSGIVYQLVDTPPHHHLVCLSCGQMQDVDDSLFARLRDTLRQQHGFEPRIEHMAIYGYCQQCQP